jgi:tripartite-type tricarboxylate transporter receptor subunit TctC
MNKNWVPNRRIFLQSSAALGAVVATTTPMDAFGAKYPSRNIHVMVPTREGGLADRNFRVFSSVWKNYLKVNFESSYYPGAAGRVGYRKFMSLAKPDGYTFLFGNMGPEVLNWAVSPPKGFTFPGDYVYFNRMDKDPTVIFVNAKQPKFNTIQEIIAEGKKRTINVAVPRLAHPASLGVMALGKHTGAKFNLVPLSGGKNTRKGVGSGEFEIGGLLSTGISRRSKSYKAVATFALEAPTGQYGKDLYDAPVVNSTFGMNLPALTSGSAFAVKTEFTKKYPEQFEMLVSTGKKVFEDPAFRAAVEKIKVPWEIISYGSPEDCARDAKNILAIGREYSHLLKG